MTGRVPCVDDARSAIATIRPSSAASSAAGIPILPTLWSGAARRISSIRRSSSPGARAIATIIVSQRGTGFDPAAVDAFLGIAE